MSSLGETIERIRQKARERTVLNPCASLAEVEAFEREHEIMLPEGYREFVLNVGNGGGDHPHYGMNPLAGTLRYDTSDTVDPRLEFPLTDFWIWHGEPVWNGEIEAEVDRVWSRGFLCLGTDGCGMYWILVTAGPERGQMWFLAGEGAQPCAPRRDFLSWYEYWLDGGDVLSGYFAEFTWPDGKVTPKPERPKNAERGNHNVG